MFSGIPHRPDCQQIYNLFHASDPSAFRLEPLLNFVFRQIPAIKIARYNKFPMGDGESIQIGKTLYPPYIYCGIVFVALNKSQFPEVIDIRPGRGIKCTVICFCDSLFFYAVQLLFFKLTLIILRYAFIEQCFIYQVVFMEEKLHVSLNFCMNLFAKLSQMFCYFYLLQ